MFHRIHPQQNHHLPRLHFNRKSFPILVILMLFEVLPFSLHFILNFDYPSIFVFDISAFLSAIIEAMEPNDLILVSLDYLK